MKKKRVGLRTFFECFLASGAIIGTLSAISLVESGTAPLMKRIAKLESEVEDKDREIEELRNKPAEIKEVIKEVEVVKEVAPTYKPAKGPRAGETG